MLKNTYIARLLFGKAAEEKNTAVAPAASKAIATTNAEWVDDTLLRELAQAHRDGKTTWVIASDMDEFFSKLDAFNDAQAPDAKVTIQIQSDIAQKLADMLEKKYHVGNEDLLKKPGRLVLEGETLIRLMGPHTMDGLRVTHRGDSRPAAYSADAVNTRLSIQTKTGEWKAISFGMDEMAGSVSSKEPSPALRLF